MSNLHNEIGTVRDDAATTRDVVTCPSCRTRWRVPPGAAARSRCRCSRCAEVFSAGDAKTPYRVRLAPAGGHPGEGAGALAPSVPVDAPVGSQARDLRVGMDDPSLADRLGRTALHGGSDRKAWTWTVVADPESSSAGPAGIPGVDDDGPAAVVAVACEAAVVEADGPARPAAEPDVEVGDSEGDRPAAGSAEPVGAGREGGPSGPASLRESPLEPLVEALERSQDPEPAATPAVDEIAEVVHDDVAGPAAVDAVPDPVSRPDRAPRPRAGTVVIVALLGATGAMAAWTWAPWLTAAAADVLARWPTTAGVDVPADPSFWAGPGAVFGLLLGWGWLRWTLRRR